MGSFTRPNPNLLRRPSADPWNVAIDISSRISPEELISRIDAFIKEWRDSKIPGELRKHGVLWCDGFTKGRSFVLRIQNTQSRFGLDCTGTVLSTAAGSRILATTMTAREIRRYALASVLISALVALISMVRAFSWPAFLETSLLFASGCALFTLISFALNRGRYEKDYRTILERLAT